MGFAFVAALWSFIWGGSALFDISGSSPFGYLVTINAVLGALFLTVGFIELFGMLAAAKQRISFARAYAYLSILATLIVIAAECLRFSVYFSHKQDLISTCTAQATGTTEVNYGSFWGPTSDQTLSATEAQQYCQDSWTRSVWTSVIWLIVSIFVSFLFISLAFSFYHQLLVPQPLAPSQAYNMNNMQRQPYNPQSGYQYPAPAGPPPTREDYVPPYDSAKVPDYYESQSFEAPKEKAAQGGKGESRDVGYTGADV